MKKIFLSCFALAYAAGAFAQEYPDANATNPEKMQWQQGFPPPKEKTLHAADGSYFNFPGLRYSVNHMQEFSVTRTVPAAKEKLYSVKTKYDENIDSITFTPWDSDKEMTFAESLDANYTDGIIIMHKGKIIYEKYPAGLKPDGVHAAMSVSKSFTGTIASILVAEGVLDPSKTVAEYIPELKNSGFADATVRQVMDMTTAIQYSEDYNDPNAEVWKYSAAGNVFRPADYKGPQNYYEYLATVKKINGQEHGEEFGYRTVNTELLAWINSRVTGKGLTELISEKIWKPLGIRAILPNPDAVSEYILSQRNVQLGIDDFHQRISSVLTSCDSIMEATEDNEDIWLNKTEYKRAKRMIRSVQKNIGK